MPPVSRIFRHPTEHRLRAPWRLLLFILVVAAVANPLILLLDATDSPILESSLENVMIALGFVVAILVAARYLDRRRIADFGLSITAIWWRELGIGLLFGGLLMTVIFAIQFALGWTEIRGTFETSIAGASVSVAVAGQCLRYLAGSVFEETLSRSYLLRMLAEALRARGWSADPAIWGSALITSLLFGALHLANDHASLLSVVNISLLGVLFAIPMIYTGRLSTSIGLHMGWNVLQNIVFGLPNGGKPSRASIWVTEDIGPSVWTGADFGPEGGGIALLVLLAGVVSTGAWMKSKRGSSLCRSLAEPPKAD